MTNQDEERDALVRVLVVDDQQLVRDGIASLLRVQAGIAVSPHPLWVETDCDTQLVNRGPKCSRK